jgi:ATP-dependent RNA helicase DeaD
MNIGRAANADPRWMIPVICRKGGITKAEIGDIRIQDRETLFEVAPGAAEAFTARLRLPDTVDPAIRIAPVVTESGAPAAGEAPPAERRYDKARPFKKRATLTMASRKPAAERGASNAGDRPFIKKKHAGLKAKGKSPYAVGWR